MTTNIQLLRSGIAYKRPAAAPLLEGQAAINYNIAEPGLFWRLTDGQLAKAGPVAITNDGTTPNSAPAGETGNSIGEEWLDQHTALFSPILHVFNGTDFVTANGFTVDKSSGDFTLLREMEVTKIIAGEGQINGNLVVGGNITPNGQNCAFFLGLPEERWDYLYGCNFDITYNGLIGRDLTVDRDVVIHNDLTVANEVKSNLIPDADATRFLGNATSRWVGYLSQLDVNGNVQIGDPTDLSCGTTLNVNSTATFRCPVDFEQPVQIDQIGESCSDTLTIFATTTFKCPVTFESTVVIDTIGTSCSDTLTINATTTFKCPVTFEQNLTGDIILGDGCNTSTINLNGAVTLSCDMMPNANNTRDIGSDANRLKAVYATDVFTGDLHLKNEKGDWTMIEAEDYLTIRNNKTGKTFRLLMEEV